jgi:uncharacterized membrane protein
LAEVLSLVVQMALGIVVPWWIVRRDLRRRPPQELARAWNDASFWTAIVAFGPLCIPVHFIKTRRSFWGLLLGVFWMAAAIFLIVLPSAGIESLVST